MGEWDVSPTFMTGTASISSFSGSAHRLSKAKGRYVAYFQGHYNSKIKSDHFVVLSIERAGVSAYVMGHPVYSYIHNNCAENPFTSYKILPLLYNLEFYYRYHVHKSPAVIPTLT